MNGNGNSGFESEANSITDEATVVKVILSKLYQNQSIVTAKTRNKMVFQLK
jgi:hypothetical protein